MRKISISFVSIGSVKISLYALLTFLKLQVRDSIPTFGKRFETTGFLSTLLTRFLLLVLHSFSRLFRHPNSRMYSSVSFCSSLLPDLSNANHIYCNVFLFIAVSSWKIWRTSSNCCQNKLCLCYSIHAKSWSRSPDGCLHLKPLTFQLQRPRY